MNMRRTFIQKTPTERAMKKMNHAKKRLDSRIDDLRYRYSQLDEKKKRRVLAGAVGALGALTTMSVMKRNKGRSGY